MITYCFHLLNMNPHRVTESTIKRFVFINLKDNFFKSSFIPSREVSSDIFFMFYLSQMERELRKVGAMPEYSQYKSFVYGTISLKQKPIKMCVPIQ